MPPPPPPGDSRREKIVQVVVDAIETILIATEGFATDIGTNVHDWETDFQQEELPATSVCDLTAEVQTNELDEVDVYRLPIQIRTMIATNTRPADARKIMADHLKALKPLKDGFKKSSETVAIATALKRQGFLMAQDGFTVEGIVTEIEVFYETLRFNAYS